MKKMKKYLESRLELLSNEKVDLISKVNEINLELEEIDFKINDLKKNMDDAVEIFSPRSKKNEQLKSEMIICEKESEHLIEIKNKYIEQIQMVDIDINIITDALDNSYDIVSNNEMDSMVDVSNELMTEKEFIAKYNDFILHLFDEQFKYNKIVENNNRIFNTIKEKLEVTEKIVEMDSKRAKVEINEIIRQTSEAIDNQIKSNIFNHNENIDEIINQLMSAYEIEENNKVEISVVNKSDISIIDKYSIFILLSEILTAYKNITATKTDTDADKIINIKIYLLEDEVKFAIKSDFDIYNECNFQKIIDYMHMKVENKTNKKKKYDLCMSFRNHRC